MSKRQYVIAGAVSGAVWFIIALLLDARWSIPTNRPLFIGAAILAGAATGEVISLLFRSAFEKASRCVFFILPVVTLPLAIALFAVFVWLARRIFGVQFEPSLSPLRELRLIVETYVIVLFSIFAPILYGLALLNQYVLRAILRRQKA